MCENKSVSSLSYPTVNDKYIIADIMHNMDEKQSKEIIDKLAILFDCMAMAPSSRDEVVQNFIKQIYVLLRDKNPEKFNEIIK